MGITYQTSNRQRRKVMTAPLNAPPADLRVTDAQEPAAARPGARSSAYWLMLVVAGAALAAGSLHFVL